MLEVPHVAYRRMVDVIRPFHSERRVRSVVNKWRFHVNCYFLNAVSGVFCAECWQGSFHEACIAESVECLYSSDDVGYCFSYRAWLRRYVRHCASGRRGDGCSHLAIAHGRTAPCDCLLRHQVASNTPQTGIVGFMLTTRCSSCRYVPRLVVSLVTVTFHE